MSCRTVGGKIKVVMLRSNLRVQAARSGLRIATVRVVLGLVCMRSDMIHTRYEGRHTLSRERCSERLMGCYSTATNHAPQVQESDATPR